MRPSLLVAPLALATLALALPARADPVVLRTATVAPEGSAWAREMAAWAREIETASNGVVRVKIYYSGIAGDEKTVLARIKREQLDGALASEICNRLAPSLKVARIVGLFQSREESAYAIGRLKPVLDQEFLRSGFVNLGEATLGPEVLLTREPVHSVAELRKTRMWIWDLDESLAVQARALGLSVVPLPVEQAGRAFDEHRIDGFIGIPTGALAFQWTTQARYLEDLRLGFRQGCVVVASRAFDALPIDAQQVIRSASAKLRVRFEDLGARQDDALIGGLFAKQGIKSVPPSEQFRAELFDLAQQKRGEAGNRIVPEALLEQMLSWLADYRAEHAR